MTFSNTHYIAEVMVKNKGTGYVNKQRCIVFTVDNDCFHENICGLREIVSGLIKDDKFHDIESVVYKKVACNYVW